MKRCLIVQNDPGEDSGELGVGLLQRGFHLEVVKPFNGEPLPESLESFAGVVILGGQAGVYETEKFSWLQKELDLAEEAVRKDIPILGICLGAQILAATLGAVAAPASRREIGWAPVFLTNAAREDPLLREIQSPLQAFHFHGDAFVCPPGAVCLAHTEVCRCQAFRFGNSAAYGFQFHPEVNAALARQMILANEEYVEGAGVDGEAVLSETEERLKELRKSQTLILEGWIDLLFSPRPSVRYEGQIAD